MSPRSGPKICIRAVGNGVHFSDTTERASQRLFCSYKGVFPKVSQKWLEKPRAINHNQRFASTAPCCREEKTCPCRAPARLRGLWPEFNEENGWVPQAVPEFHGTARALFLATWTLKLPGQNGFLPPPKLRISHFQG